MKKFILALLAISFFFFSCDSPTESEYSGIITFTFGDSPAARWTNGPLDSDVKKELTHVIKLKNGNYNNTVTAEPGVATKTVTGVPLGSLEVTIDATKNGYPFAHGATEITVVQGNNNKADVPMNRIKHGIVLSEKPGSTYHFPVLSPVYGAGDLVALTVTVYNYAENDTGALSAAITGTDNGSFNLTGPSIANIPQDDSATFYVRPAPSLALGTYTATVSVTGDNDIDAFFTVSVMVGTDFNVASTSDWTNACNIISTGGNGKSYTINVTADISAPSISPTFGTVTGLNVTITGNHFIRATNTLLDIGANQTVILKDTPLKGGPGNTGMPVYVNGGTFNMEGGSISDNTYSSNYSASGGGVYVASGGTFNMSGGEISGNSTNSGNSQAYGGGVYVDIGGTFNMTGGEISGNSALNGGGGVINGGTFNMTGGTISGNTTGMGGGGGVFNNGTFTMSGTAAITSNTGYTGGGVYVNSGTFDLKSMDLVGDNTANAATNPGKKVYVNGGTFKVDGNAPDPALNNGTDYYWP